MNIAVLAPLGQWRAIPGRARALFNGFGYVFGFSLIYNAWTAIPGSSDQIATGNLWLALHQYLGNLSAGMLAVIPGLVLVPLVINLPARSGVIRGIYVVVAAIVMFVWCERVEGVRYSWNWQTVGFVGDGFLNTILVVGVCAYHGHARAASDALISSRIARDRRRMELTRARLRLLQAQIEPHFLFNTLSVARALAKSDRAATVAMLGHLIRYFEAALPRMRDGVVPLQQEFEIVDAYLAIFRARMGARLTYDVSAPRELARLRVPSMMLLTLVENALKHGVSPSLQGGCIRVSAARRGNSLLLEVTDNGSGLHARQGRGTGLANIRERLLMTYGPEATLSLRANQPCGVAASISVPVR